MCLMILFESHRKTERGLNHWCIPRMHKMSGSGVGLDKVGSWEVLSDLPDRWQELLSWSHYYSLPDSELAFICNEEPKPGIKSRHSDMGQRHPYWHLDW